MRAGLLGITALTAAMALGHGMDVDVQFSNPAGSARIRIYQVPAREPLGAVKLRLKLSPQAGMAAVASTAPAAGPWSQFAPQLRRAGDEMIVWAMAPNIGESKDSGAQLIADLNVSLSPSKPMAAAADLIDSLIVAEAWSPFGKKTTLTQNLTTGLRSSGEASASGPVERMRGSLRTLDFTLAKAQRVQVYVSDFRGRRVAAILDGKLGAGMHQVEWDGKADGGKPLPAGSYFLRLEAGAYAYDRKLEVGR